MFADAYEIVHHFTRPVIVSTRFFDKSVECDCGSFVVLNKAGWVLTVEHIWRTFHAYLAHKIEIASYRDEVAKLDADQKLTIKQKHKKAARLIQNPKWITNHSFWWGDNNVQLKDIRALPEGDLILGRLEPFDSTRISDYPIIKDPSALKPGTSLCKLGYPFHEIKASFNEANNAFELDPNALPLPRFPIEGIYTRNMVAGRSKDGRHQVMFLETSSPGLRGQSGGPIFDTKGTLWAIQSQTRHLPLGFSPKVKKGNKEVAENQFLNVGIGVHPQTIVEFLQSNGVSYVLSKY